MEIKIELWQRWKRHKARCRIEKNKIRKEKQAAYREALLSKRAITEVELYDPEAPHNQI